MLIAHSPPSSAMSTRRPFALLVWVLALGCGARPAQDQDTSRSTDSWGDCYWLCTAECSPPSWTCEGFDLYTCKSDPCGCDYYELEEARSEQCPPVVATWQDDGERPTDTDGDGVPDTGCGDTVEIEVNDPTSPGPWTFGMVDPDTWTGEDCFQGTCHPIGLVTVLTEVCTEAELVPGSTTLVDFGMSFDLTYYWSNASICRVWGWEPEYYDALGCTVW